jgi:1,4-dihydroxy-6-naphthoate synthase
MVSAAAEKVITFAHSPDPDDAYMFYGFASGAVTVPGYRIRHHLEDIQTLNERAFRGEFEITAVSAHAYAHLMDKYWVMNCGASVGRGYGPILVGKSELASPSSNVRIAVPGKWTTAALVLDLWLAEQGWCPEKIMMPFDHILPAAARGEIDAGLIIHEGQLTYQNEGVRKLWDAGHWWMEKTQLPLPLGLDVVRSDLGMPLARQLSRALRESIVYANTHQDEAIEYALQYGRGLDRDLGKRFVGMYVNDDTLNQGDSVRRGLTRLYEEAYAHQLIPRRPQPVFIEP